MKAVCHWLAVATLVIGVTPSTAFAQTRAQTPTRTHDAREQTREQRREQPRAREDDRKREETPVQRRRGSSPGVITSRERVRWFLESTAGPGSLAGAGASAAWGTSRGSGTRASKPETDADSSSGYAPGMKGFGTRYAIAMGDSALRNGLEASLGAVWHEDPRYVRSSRSRGGQGNAFARIGHAARMTVLAPRPGGELAPAYARFAGVTGSALLSNAWRPPEERSARDTLLRSASTLGGTFAANVFQEFWPDIRRMITRQPHSPRER